MYENVYFGMIKFLYKIIVIKEILLWKESLNIDGQQFHQYQQNKQSPLGLTHRKHTHMRARTHGHAIWWWQSRSRMYINKICVLIK